MLVAQITDIHLGFDPGNPDEFNRQRLDQTLRALMRDGAAARICCSPPATSPTMATTRSPTGASARRSPACLSRSVRRWAIMTAATPSSSLSRTRRSPTASSNMRSRISRSASSSSTRSRSGGTAAASARPAPPGCATRLAEAPGRPTLIVLHHPPIETGLSWMTENPEADWVLRLQRDRRGACQYRRA